MRKSGTILILCIAFLIIYFLQLNFFSNFTIAGVKPNLFIIFVLFIGLYAGKEVGAIFGVFIGLWIDFLGSDLIGISAIALGAIGFFGGYLEKSLSKDSKITVMILVAAFSVAYETFIYLYRGAILSANIEILLFIKILTIEVIYNTLLTIILYPAMQHFGYKIEDVFKKTQILTRYF